MPPTDGCGIGYQWSYSEGILALKRDIQAGRFGAPVRLKAICLWPRPRSYYRRNAWAGKLRDEATGRWILDSPLNNALAHFLHNLLYLLGPTTESSAALARVTAEACRANPIESYDTAACRACTPDGVELLFYGSHASRDSWGPRFDLEFEEARVSCEAATEGHDAGAIVVEAGGQQVATYASPDADGQGCEGSGELNSSRSDTVRRDSPLNCWRYCSLAMTLPRIRR